MNNVDVTITNNSYIESELVFKDLLPYPILKTVDGKIVKTVDGKILLVRNEV